jgi:hypothetical protein
MTKEEFAKSISSGFFADRDTLPEAFDYAYSVFKHTENPAAVMTALHVVLNTVAKEILKLEDKETV